MIDFIEEPRTLQVQKYGLEILSVFHEICEENSLNYILDYGTLLGAIRHDGFIPWDDDIDISMPREDYERFKEIAKESLPQTMFLQNHESDSNYYSILPKVRLINDDYREEMMKHFDIVHGPWLDIFVYDYKHDDKIIEKNKQNAFDNKIKFYKFITPTVYSNNYENQFFLKTIIKKIVIYALEKSQVRNERGKLMKSLDYKYNKLESIMQDRPTKNKSGEMKTYCFPTESGIAEERLTLNIRDFQDRKLKSFEDTFLYIPDNYKKILTKRYGNYRELPPYEDRKSNHLWAD